MKRETIKMEETRKQPSKSEVIGSFIVMGMRLSADNIDAERNRHDAAIEALQKAQIE